MLLLRTNDCDMETVKNINALFKVENDRLNLPLLHTQGIRGETGEMTLSSIISCDDVSVNIIVTKQKFWTFFDYKLA
jgi:hypothetical protein